MNGERKVRFRVKKTAYPELTWQAFEQYETLWQGQRSKWAPVLLQAGFEQVTSSAFCIPSIQAIFLLAPFF